MEWKVAPSYKNWTIEKVNEEARKAYVTTSCGKCGGSGQYAWFGVCFRCGGSGHEAKWVKAYTPEEYVKYIASQERAKQKRMEAAEARRQAALDQSEENKKARLKEWGYDPENPLIWLIGGGKSTYEIKDWLKEQGCKFCKELGWFSCRPLDLPDGYDMVSIKFEDVYTWYPQTKRFDIKDNAKEIADAALATLFPESESEYVGEIKERIRDLEVTLTGSRTIDSYYGVSTVYTFVDTDENVLIWITASPKEIKVGDHILLTGTVKDHLIRNGVKQTYLNRCIIKKG